MTIRVEEKGSIDFYAEGLDLAQQVPKLRKKPERRLKNTLRDSKIYIVVCLGMSAALLAWIYLVKSSFAALACLTLLLVCAAYSFRKSQEFRKVARTFMEQFKSYAFTLDETGISQTRYNVAPLSLQWKDLAFVRILRENIVFMGKQEGGFLLTLDIRYKDQVLEYLKENQPGVRIIQ